MEAKTIKQDQKSLLFEQTPIPKAIATLALPTIISSLVMVIYNLADTYFVGMLNNPVENAAVTLAAPVLLAFNAVINLFGVGSSSMISRALGSKDYEAVYESSSLGFYLSVISGLIFSLACAIGINPLLSLLGADTTTASSTAAYLKWVAMFGAAPAILNVVMAYMIRSEGAALHASIGTMSGCILNMILDPFFILPWGLGMGAQGAGLATFLSNCVACLYFGGYLLLKKKDTCIRVSPSALNLKDTRIIVSICAVGIPAAIQNLLNVTGMTILNNFTALYGADAVAAMGITQKINMIPTYIVLGLSQGIMPLISYNYSCKNARRTKDTVLFSSKILLCFILALTAFDYVFAPALIGIFMKNEAIITYGSRFLRGFCLSLPFLAIDFLSVGVFQATGKGKEALIFAILRKIILEIPALILLNLLFPLYGLAYAQLAAELVLSVAAVLVLAKMFKTL